MPNVRRLPTSHELGRLPIIESSLAARAAATARAALFSETETASGRDSVAGLVAASVTGSARQLAVSTIQTQPPAAAPDRAVAAADPRGAATVLARRPRQTTPIARAGGLL